jgi:putative membrane protein
MNDSSGDPIVQNRLLRFGLNFLRGALIGIAEIIPGVSGGTIALITGVYTRIINSAAEAVRALVLLFSFSKIKWVQAGVRFRSMSWSLLIPLLIGMVTAIFATASIVEPLLTNHPSLSKALFAGLIAASLIVPIKLIGGDWKAKHFALLLLSAALAFALASIPKAPDATPEFFVIFGSAAVAVCALVLPGVSGSYLLLALGMYAPTLSAVNDLDFGYLVSFVAGAVLGLAAFVSLLQWLLTEHRRTTLVVMTGLMIGSLRALWPWQGETGALELPSSSFIFELVAFAIGVSLVLLLSFYQSWLARSRK